MSTFESHLDTRQKSVTNPDLDRRLTIVGAYVRWVEPLFFPAIVVPCLAIFASSTSLAFLCSIFLIPIVCIALFQANNAIFQSGKLLKLFRSTPFFSLTLIVSGGCLMLLLAGIPIVAISQISESSLPSIASTSNLTRLDLAIQLTFIVSLIGVTIRLILLALEEFRYLSREHFKPEDTERDVYRDDENRGI